MTYSSRPPANQAALIRTTPLPIVSFLMMKTYNINTTMLWMLSPGKPHALITENYLRGAMM
jgi:hypothetical protein